MDDGIGLECGSWSNTKGQMLPDHTHSLSLARTCSFFSSRETFQIEFPISTYLSEIYYTFAHDHDLNKNKSPGYNNKFSFLIGKHLIMNSLATASFSSSNFWINI